MTSSQDIHDRAKAIQAREPGTSYEVAVLKAAELPAIAKMAEQGDGASPGAPDPTAHLTAAAHAGDGADLHGLITAKLAKLGFTDRSQPGYSAAYKKALADLGNAHRAASQAMGQQKLVAAELAHGSNADLLLRAHEIMRSSPTSGDETEYQLLRRSIAQAGAERTRRERGL